MPFDFLESRLLGARASTAYRRIVQPVMNALVKEAEVHGVAAAEFDLEPAFVRSRFVDWTLVHFAISAETEVFGLERRPVDILLRAGEHSGPYHLKSLAAWLAAGQASHAAVVALKNAVARERLAKLPEECARAKQRLACLRTPDKQQQRDRLALQALAAWSSHGAALDTARWTVTPIYPEGFARRSAISSRSGRAGRLAGSG